jgi:hypothetical protein
MSGPWDRDQDAWRHQGETGRSDRDARRRDPDDAGWDDWSGIGQPSEPSTQPISSWDEWPAPPPEPEPEELEPEPPVADPWAERWDREAWPSADRPMAPTAPDEQGVPAWAPPEEQPPAPVAEPPLEPEKPWAAELPPGPAEAPPEPEPAEREPFAAERESFAAAFETVEPERAEPLDAATEAPAAWRDIPAAEPPAEPEEPELELETPAHVEPVAERDIATVFDRAAALGLDRWGEVREPPAEPRYQAPESETAAPSPEDVAESEEAEAPQTPQAHPQPQPAAAEPEAALAEPGPAPAPPEAAFAEPQGVPTAAGVTTEPPMAAELEPGVEAAIEQREELEAPLRESPDEWEPGPPEEPAAIGAEAEAPAERAAAGAWDEIWSARAPEPSATGEASAAETEEPPGETGAEATFVGELTGEITAEPQEEAGDQSQPLTPSAGEVRTATREPWPGTERRRATTAEHAVPWLIGIILLLAGMVVVLMALIFSGDESLGLTNAAPTTTPSALPTRTAAPTASVRATPQPTPSAAPTPPPAPAAQFGALEMVFQGRATALAPIYLLRHDFTTQDDVIILAQDPSLDVRDFDWAPDGSRGAALLADILVSVEQGAETRRLAEGIVTLTFGADASTIYAVRIVESGANDTATVLAIDFVSGATVELASMTYLRPVIGPEDPLKEAQFADEGGAVRLCWTNDGKLRLWILGASGWSIDPATGAIADLGPESFPALWAPELEGRIVVAEAGTTSTLVNYDSSGNEVSRTTTEGLVSHIRWAPDGSQVVLTLGRTGPSGGGVRQDLFMWNLEAGALLMPMTTSGAAFGAEWLGAAPVWKP